jgi:hypothetical protein
MTKKLIGAWSSVALFIFLFSVWLGYEAGVGIAHKQNLPQLWRLGSLNNVGKQQLDATLPALTKVYALRFNGAHEEEKLNGSNLYFEIDQLKALEAQPNTKAISSVVELHLAIASIGVSALEQRANDTTKARASMESAKALLRSLGWQDCSEETLRAVKQKEIDRWNVKAFREATPR